jgi:hypothetical protein
MTGCVVDASVAVPKIDIESIHGRLRRAREEYDQWSRSGKNGSR